MLQLPCNHPNTLPSRQSSLEEPYTYGVVSVLVNPTWGRYRHPYVCDSSTSYLRYFGGYAEMIYKLQRMTLNKLIVLSFDRMGGV